MGIHIERYRDRQMDRETYEEMQRQTDGQTKIKTKTAIYMNKWNVLQPQACRDILFG
jgi:hypothetical protein